MSKKVTIICGATSTGKSSYAFELSKNLGQVNILSVDSRQFYKHLPIVSGQDQKKDIPANVTIFGQGILNPDESSNISDFKKYAFQIITRTKKEKKSLLIVGGSGLYLKAITENLEYTSVPPDPDFRKQAEELELVDLQNILKDFNLNLFNSLNNSDINNPRRLIRHIEITRTNPTSEICDLRPDTSYSWIGLRKSPENLLKSIEKRVLSRLKSGAVDEVKTLLKNYPNTALPIYTTLGVKQIVSFINQEIDLDELKRLWTQADLSYAKRQMVWFKKQLNILWYDNDI